MRSIFPRDLVPDLACACIVACCGLIVPLPLHAQVTATATNTAPAQPLQVEFASVEHGREILATQDDFLTRLSPFDLQSRVRSATPVSRESYLASATREVLPWSDEDKARIHVALDALQSRVQQQLGFSLPTITMVHTSGREESGAAYTRGTAIFLPTERIRAAPRALSRLLAHELFHVISRDNPQMRDALYAIVGFKKTREVQLPPSLRDLRITNPDAPVIQHVMTIGENDDERLVAPVLFANGPYDPEQRDRMFDYLQFKLMQVELLPSGEVRPVMVDGEPVFASPMHPDFQRQIGRNTGYIIHPEEILADNFADLLMGRKTPPDPWIPEKMAEILATSH